MNIPEFIVGCVMIAGSAGGIIKWGRKFGWKTKSDILMIPYFGVSALVGGTLVVASFL